MSFDKVAYRVIAFLIVPFIGLGTIMVIVSGEPAVWFWLVMGTIVALVLYGFLYALPKFIIAERKYEDKMIAEDRAEEVMTKVPAVGWVRNSTLKNVALAAYLEHELDKKSGRY